MSIDDNKNGHALKKDRFPQPALWKPAVGFAVGLLIMFLPWFMPRHLIHSAIVWLGIAVAIGCLFEIWWLGFSWWAVGIDGRRLLMPRLRFGGWCKEILIGLGIAILVLLMGEGLVRWWNIPDYHIIETYTFGGWGLTYAQRMAGLICYSLVGILLAPVGEELLFRGLLYTALRRKMHFILAALMQAIPFGLIHFYHWSAILTTGLTGFALALIYEWRKKLWTTMAIHAWVNVASFSVLLIIFIQSGNRPMMGIRYEYESDKPRITQVIMDSSAYQAGLEEGDRIIRIDGRQTDTAAVLQLAIQRKSAGESVTLEIRRGEQILEKTLTLMRRRDLE